MSDLDHCLRIHDEARAWLYELKTADDPEFSAFLRWLDESEDNLVAYLNVCREWAKLTGGVPPPRYVRQADRLFFEGVAALLIACVADALWVGVSHWISIHIQAQHPDHPPGLLR